MGTALDHPDCYGYVEEPAACWFMAGSELPLGDCLGYFLRFSRVSSVLFG